MSSAEIGAGPVNPVESLVGPQCRTDLPDFRIGDTVRVYSKVIEGTKERLQAFVGVVIKRHKGKNFNATFTVRKVSYGVGVERTFLLHSPLISSMEVVTHGKVRRARLFYLRPLRGKAARIKGRAFSKTEQLGEAEAVTSGDAAGTADPAAGQEAVAVE